MDDLFQELDRDLYDMKKREEQSECVNSLNSAISMIEGNKLVSKKSTTIKGDNGEEMVDIMFSEFFILIRKK